jgi:hypothetical protein
MAGKCGKVGLSGDAWVGWDEEAANAYGTKVGPGAGTKFGLPSSDGLEDTKEVLDPPSISQAYTDIAQVFVGKQFVEGGLAFPMPYEGFEHLLLHGMGAIAATASPGSGSFGRNFDLTSNGRFRHATSPSLSLHVSRGIVGSGSTNPLVFSYLGCVVDSMKISCKRGEALFVEWGFFGKNPSVATSSQAATFPTAPLANFTECVVTWGGVEIPVTSFEINFSRGIDKDRFFLGQTSTCEPPMTKNIVTGSFETEWDNEIRAGSTTLQADNSAGTDRILKFAFTSTKLMTGMSAQHWRLDFELNNAVITKLRNPIVPGRIIATCDFKGYDSNLATTPHELRIFQQALANYTE